MAGSALAAGARCGAGELTAQRVTNLYDLMDRGYESDLIGEHSRRLGHVPIIDAQTRGEHSVPMAPHQALRFRERTPWSESIRA
jgi:hypothetical protein